MLNTLVNKLSIHNGLQSVLFVASVVATGGRNDIHFKSAHLLPESQFGIVIIVQQVGNHRKAVLHRFP